MCTFTNIFLSYLNEKYVDVQEKINICKQLLQEPSLKNEVRELILKFLHDNGEIMTV
jgi:hypothetical protein